MAKRPYTITTTTVKKAKRLKAFLLSEEAIDMLTDIANLELTKFSHIIEELIRTKYQKTRAGV
jgi:hypothetical protein